MTGGVADDGAGGDGAVTGDADSDSDGAEGIRLSTGETVHLPLETEATMVGGVFSVPRSLARSLLPDGLRPIRATIRGNAAITLLSVEYDAIGVEGLPPYDEFAMIVPAVHDRTPTVPYLSALRRGVIGWVHAMPVTTESAVALGVDVWGYPKELGYITHQDEGARRQTRVHVGGERVCTLTVVRPPSRRRTLRGASYTRMDGTLQRVPSTVEGEVGAWPLSTAVDLSLGTHEIVDPLRSVDYEGRVLARLGLEGTVTFGAPEAIDTR